MDDIRFVFMAQVTSLQIALDSAEMKWIDDSGFPRETQWKNETGQYASDVWILRQLVDKAMEENLKRAEEAKSN